jgi:hypothetical protein
MSAIVCKGQGLTVGFLALCCLFAVLNILRGLATVIQAGLLFAVAQTVFTLFAGTAAWNIRKWNKPGWYLGLIVVLQWVGSLVNLGPKVGWFTMALTVPMAMVGVWLYLPSVRARFATTKAFG